jgi:hypothetical protein
MSSPSGTPPITSSNTAVRTALFYQAFILSRKRLRLCSGYPVDERRCCDRADSDEGEAKDRK